MQPNNGGSNIQIQETNDKDRSKNPYQSYTERNITKKPKLKSGQISERNKGTQSLTSRYSNDLKTVQISSEESSDSQVLPRLKVGKVEEYENNYISP